MRCSPGILPALAAAILVAGSGPAVAAAGAGHADLACRTCHDGAGGAAAVDDPSLQVRCAGCHADAAAKPAGGLSFHGRGRCLACHRFHAPETVVTAAGTLDLGDLAGVDRAHCLGCHDGRGSLADLSEAHRAAGRLYHENLALLRDRAPSTPCLWCHSGDRATDWQAVPADDRIAFSEHASHPFAVEVVAGRGTPVRRMRDVIDPRIPLPGGRIECVSCHRLTPATKDRLIALGSTPKDLCLGCHQLKEPAGGAAVAVARLGTP